MCHGCPRILWETVYIGGFHHHDHLEEEVKEVEGMSQLSDAITERAEVQRSGAGTVYELMKDQLSTDRQQQEFAAALGGTMAPERFIRVALTELRRNPKLLTATRESLLGALMVSAQLGLEPGGPLGHLYLVPYRNQIQLIPGYKGLIALAAREGIAIDAHAVHRGDSFEYAYGLRPRLEHIPADDADELTHVWAIARAGGHRWMRVLTKKEVEQYRRRSMAADTGPWVTDYEAMAIKTAIRRLFSVVPVQAGSRFAEAVNMEDGIPAPAPRPVIDVPLPAIEEEPEEETTEEGEQEAEETEPIAEPLLFDESAEDAPQASEPVDGGDPMEEPFEATEATVEANEDPYKTAWDELADLLAKAWRNNTPTEEIRRRIRRLFELMAEVGIPRWAEGALAAALSKRDLPTDLDALDRWQLQMFAAPTWEFAKEAISATDEP